jgi:hypothetical protein
MILDTKDVNLISKIVIGVSIPVMIIVGLSFGLQMYDKTIYDLEKKLPANFDIREQEIAWNIIKSYKGVDDEGSNLFDTIITQIENVYPNEKILQHRDTILKISVLYTQEQNDVGFYEVKFTFQTYDDVREYIWNVNIETEEIISINDGARKMMNIVDSYN